MALDSEIDMTEQGIRRARAEAVQKYMSTRSTVHHDPNLPQEARKLLDRIASALERIADSQERKVLSTEGANKVLGGALQTLMPQILSMILKPANPIAVPSAADTPGRHETEKPEKPS